MARQLRDKTEWLGRQVPWFPHIEGRRNYSALLLKHSAKWENFASKKSDPHGCLRMLLTKIERWGRRVPWFPHIVGRRNCFALLLKHSAKWENFASIKSDPHGCLRILFYAERSVGRPRVGVFQFGLFCCQLARQPMGSHGLAFRRSRD